MTVGSAQSKNKGRVWEWIFPFIFSIAGVAILFAAQFATALGFVIKKIDYSKYEGTYSFIYSVIAIIALLAFSRLTRVFYLDSKSGLLIKKPLVSEVLFTIVIAMGLLGVVSIYMMLVNILAKVGGDTSAIASELEEYETTIDRYSDIAVEVVPFFDKILNYIAVAVLVPIAEETLFRGIILGHFLKKYNAAISIIISAVVFGLLHGISIHIGYALISGLVIGSVYYFTSNMMMTVLIHMIFNFFGGTLSVILSDGWFNIPTETYNNILIRATSVEILCMTPAVIFFIILWTRKSKANRLAAETKEETAVEE
ncbi:MAG: CPBP family intramembrane metalloprotease [Clostridia bacterium]|nr:CPBP family intramembrane metalloprotease [Clostridia bacterium]